MQRRELWRRHADATSGTEIPHALMHDSLRAVVCDTNGSALSEYGLVTIADLVSLSSVEGKLAVGGDFLSSTATTVASLPSDRVSTITLQIAGDIVSGVPIRLESGSALVGTGRSVSSTTPWEYRVSGRRFRLMDQRGGATISTSSDLAAHSIHLSERLKEYSLSLSLLHGTNPVVVEENDGKDPDIVLEVATVDPSGIAIFTIDSNLIFGAQTGTIKVNNDMGAKLIIVNVAGTSQHALSANFSGAWFSSALGKSRTLWNLFEATTVDLGSTVFKGSLLAPLADVFSIADIEGAVVAKTLTSTASIKAPLLDESVCVEADNGTIDLKSNRA
jgi:choice-of-anchor A domain-containing protein